MRLRWNIILWHYLDTKWDMTTKVAITMNRMFLLNIKKNVPKYMYEGWDLALAYEIWAYKLWYLEDDGIKGDIEWSIIHYTSKSVVWRMFGEQAIPQELSKWVYIKSISTPIRNTYRYSWSYQKCLFGKNQYFLLFINDYSRKTWVNFLKIYI
jgi:hypothetical protein